ncbi:hypothetical protein HPB48_000313 [Haemaphysalis longicornis]|uniref:SWIM-type domain-containing protein n=1 Tax=Haemaphysalis longicornis TaxID=44386 RepID=A0A9J6FC25_HAELO|nr:hypothetical protein HPB48_000313 [Haemaphysalis longicornis]
MRISSKGYRKDRGQSNCGIFPNHSAKPASQRMQRGIGLTSIKKSGYRMFKANKVRQVLLCRTDHHVWVKASVEASFALSKLYKTSVVILQSDASITEAGCECRAGATGVCKHVAALLWLLLDAVLSDTHFVSETSCTERARSWKTGSKKSNVSHLKFSELNFVKHEPGKQKVFVPTTKQIGVKVTEDDLVGLHRALKKRKINPMLASVLEDASFTPQEIVSLPEKACTASLPIQLPTEVLWVEHVHSTYNNNNCALSVEEAWELEATTRLQSRSEVWHAERSKRLTASHLEKLCHDRKKWMKNSYPGYLATQQ